MSMTKKKKIILIIVSIALVLAIGGVTVTLILVFRDKGKGEIGDFHRYEGTLHKVNVTPTQNPFVAGGTTEYKIVFDSTNYYKETAGNFIVNHVKNATMAKIGVQSPNSVNWDANGKYIIMGEKALFEKAGLKMPTDDIGFSGYYIKTAGNSVFIMANDDFGYQMGAIAFLRAVLGYDMLADDCVIYEKDGATLPNMEIIERPDYDYRQSPNKMNFDTTYGMGFTNDSDVWIPVGGSKFHNSFMWFPLETYYDAHPKWYSPDTSKGDKIGEEAGQLCYTAHGDKDEYNLMIETAFEVAKKAISESTNPAARNVSFTIQDNPTSCNCEACSEEVRKYGCISATTIKFINEVDNKLQKWLQEQADKNGTQKREINIVFFAYYAWETPPTTKDSDGKFSAIDNLVCNDNVGVYIAPIQAKYTVSFYNEAKNKNFADNIRGWAVCSKLVYMWLYQTNFNHYLYPMNNWDVLADNYIFCKENNAVFMYDEGQLNQPTATAFTRLKDYISSKVEFDLNANYNEIIDKYFNNYFLDASVYMREFFDEMQTYLRVLEEQKPNILVGSIRDNLSSTDLWKQATLESWVDKINLAYKAVEKYKSSDVDLYNKLVRRIKIESVFPRYALCTLYSGMYDDVTLNEMRRSLRDDCVSLGIERSAEWTMINTTFQSWGL